LINTRDKNTTFMTGARLTHMNAHGADCSCCNPIEDDDLYGKELEEEQTQKRSGERGNVLWFILIGVALLATLTLTLTRSGSGVDQAGDVEKRRIAASQLLRYARGVEAAIEKMKLQNISENDISFENTDTATDYTNSNCGDNTCRLFHREGAGLSYEPFSNANDGSDWIFTGANNVGSTSDPVGTTAAGSGNDLVMLLPNASQSLCLQINRDLNVGTAGTLPTDADGIDTTAFTGSYAIGGPNIINVDGENAGCFETGGTTYFYYTVLTR